MSVVSPPRDHYRASATLHWIETMKAQLRHERMFRDELAGFFAGHALDVAARVEELDLVSRADALHVIDPAAMQAELNAITRSHLDSFAAIVAALEIDAIRKALATGKAARRLRAKQDELLEVADPLDLEDEDDDLGAGILDEPLETAVAFPSPAIETLVVAYVDDLFRQPFWRGISESTAEEVETILADAGTGSRAAEQIREKLGGSAATNRAEAIATVETTGAANAARHAAGVTYIDAASGVIGALSFRKIWGAINDPRVRATHLANDGIAIPIDAEFNVGGFPARWPADWKLPVHERANCRCGLTIEVT